MWNKRKEDAQTLTAETPPVAVGPLRDAVPVSNAPPASGNSIAPGYPPAVIGKSVTVRGSVFSGEDLTIDGEVEGLVDVRAHRLTVGPNGMIRAGVKAREIMVSGTIHGDVEASDKIEIRNGATLVGDIQTARIVIEDGAYFKGSVNIVRHSIPVAAAAAVPSSIDDTSVLEGRYMKLVEKKYLQELSNGEEAEMETLAATLSAADADFYEPVLQRLRSANTPAASHAVRMRERSH